MMIEDDLKFEVSKLLEDVKECDLRIAELEKDAARYRWLRENHVITEYGDGYINFRWYNAPMGGGGNLEATLELHRASCDKAIDAALRARP